jgi:signal transduction histidine kinase
MKKGITDIALVISGFSGGERSVFTFETFLGQTRRAVFSWFFTPYGITAIVGFGLLFACGVGFCVLRRRGGDASMVLKRGTVFFMSVAVIALLFFALEFCVEKFFYSNDEVVDIGAAVAGAFAFLRIKLYFEKVTDGIFFRGQYDYADATAKASEIFSSTIDLPVLRAATEGFLAATIKPGWVDFFLADARAARGFAPISEESSSALLDGEYAAIVEGFFRRESGNQKPVRPSGICPGGHGTVFPDIILSNGMGFGIGAMVPTFSRGRMNAALVIGKKKSGDGLSCRDRKLLAVISHQVGMAVENAALYGEAKRHAEEMECRVAERTERIKNMHEAQSKFLADLSHEFQTPLTILKMNVEVFAKKPLSERRKAAYMMETTLDRLSRLTRGLVDVARFDFFKETFQKRQVDVLALLKDVRDDCLILAKDRDIALSVEGDCGNVSGDRDKLKEVLLNLLGNALKHTRAGGSVILSARRGEGEMEIAVTDSGKGIPSRNLPMIFERFYRIDGGFSEGTGLGLHLCRKIIEAHGGTIVAESSVGRGSRFVMYLPLAEDGEGRK